MNIIKKIKKKIVEIIFGKPKDSQEVRKVYQLSPEDYARLPTTQQKEKGRLLGEIDVMDEIIRKKDKIIDRLERTNEDLKVEQAIEKPL